MFAPRLPEAFDGYTVIQVSDLHMRQRGRREKILDTLLRELPPADLVAVTGDLVHTPAGIAPFLKLAEAFNAKDGVYAVWGNSEHKNGIRPYALARTLAENNITPLMNSHVLISRGDSQIVLAGVDDPRQRQRRHRRGA